MQIVFTYETYTNNACHQYCLYTRTRTMGM